MVRVEAPPQAVSPEPPRARSFPWPAAVAVALLLSALLPWERWCSGGSVDDVDPLGRCFSAPLWGGSASLAGLVLIGLASALLVASLRRPGRPSPVHVALLTAILATLGVKLVIAAQNMTMAARSNTLVSGFPAGFWVGLVIGLLGILVAIASMDFAPLHRRRNLLHLGVVVAIVALAVPYARSGLAWWGGPLAHPRYLGGGNGSGHVVQPGEPLVFQHLLYVQNAGDPAVVLDGIDIVDPSAPIHVTGTYVACVLGGCPSDPVTLDVRPQPMGRLYPLEGYRLEPTDIEGSVILTMVLTVPEPGVYRSGWFRIRYHVGPLRYEVFRTDRLVICAPAPGEKDCPGDWFGS